MGGVRGKAGVFGFSAMLGRRFCKLMRHRLGSELGVRLRRIGSLRVCIAVGSSMLEALQIVLFRFPIRCLRGFLGTRLGGVCWCCRWGDAWVLIRMVRGFRLLRMRAD
jgi:hypothetical protein